MSSAGATGPMSSAGATRPQTVTSLVSARLDRLPWTRFHWRVILSLGAVWILDGLEITIVASVGTVLQDRATLLLTAGDVGLLGSVYLLAEVVGALFFGRLTDILGRNLAGPLLIGHLFDTVGRRKMITFTYSASGILLAISALLFAAGSLTAITQTLSGVGSS